MSVIQKAALNAQAHPYLLAAGGVLIILGLLMWRWSGRHDLKGLAMDAVWQIVRNKGNLATRTEIRDRLKALEAEQSNLARARAVAGHATRHLLAQVVGWVGFVVLLAGLAAVTGVLFWL